MFLFDRLWSGRWGNMHWAYLRILLGLFIMLPSIFLSHFLSTANRIIFMESVTIFFLHFFLDGLGNWHHFRGKWAAMHLWKVIANSARMQYSKWPPTCKLYNNIILFLALHEQLEGHMRCHFPLILALQVHWNGYFLSSKSKMATVWHFWKYKTVTYLTPHKLVGMWGLVSTNFSMINTLKWLSYSFRVILISKSKMAAICHSRKW